MRSAVRWGACAGLTTTFIISTLAAAQSGPDLSDLLTVWARGRYVSPVLCELDGKLVRGIRRVVIQGEKLGSRPATLRVQLIDMQPGDAKRCVNSMGQPQPNALGKLQLRLVGRPHPETAQRDFKRKLEHERKFDLEIASGRLKLQDVTVPPSEPRIVDFGGGRAAIGLVLPATDAQRELKDFRSPRKRVLELESPEGDRLRLPLVLFDEG